MKNREKYAQKMIDIVLSDNNIAISLKDNRPVSCLNYECENCLIRNYSEAMCSIEMCSLDKLREWAESEYKESIKLTPEQVRELEYYHAHGYTFVTRFYEHKPDRVSFKSNNNKSLSAYSICPYPQLDTGKNYDIKKLLEDNKNEE